MLSIVVVVVFFVIVAILTGRGDVQPRYGAVQTHRIPLQLITTGEEVSKSNFNSSSSSSSSSSLALRRRPSSVYTATFAIGHSRNLSLAISTTTGNIILRPDVYRPSPYTIDLHTPGTANVSLDGNVSVATVTYEIRTDHVGIDSVRVSAQAFANLVVGADGSASEANSSLQSAVFGGADGIFGLLPGRGTIARKASWTTRVQDSNYVPNDRFGLLLRPPAETDAGLGDGSELFLGGLDQDSLRGKLVSVPVNDIQTWSVPGTVLSGAEVVGTQQSVVFESSTLAVLGPQRVVQMLFDAAGVQSVMETDGRLRGYYDCQNPPQIGFGFGFAEHGGAADGGTGGEVFLVDAGSAGSDLGNGTCLSVVEGVATFATGDDDDGGGDQGSDRWVLGHAFMRGKYIDFNMEDQTVGIGILNPQAVPVT